MAIPNRLEDEDNNHRCLLLKSTTMAICYKDHKDGPSEIYPHADIEFLMLRGAFYRLELTNDRPLEFQCVLLQTEIRMEAQTLVGLTSFNPLRHY